VRGAWLALLSALQFLTRLPSPSHAELGYRETRAAVAWFPAVGLIIGGILVAVDRGAALILDRVVVDALLVAALAAVTGALHLDGLIDSVDGLTAGPDGTARLAAMRESAAGTAGAAAACLLILASFVALGALDDGIRPRALLLAPLLGRAAIVYAYWRYPYGRAERTVSLMLKEGATTRRALVSLGATLVAAVAIGAWGGLILLVLVGAVTISIAGIAQRRLPGLTGDVCGAICETGQLAALLCAPIALRA
jgi:adenosylcobinamide-GDP ribazoletransferase